MTATNCLDTSASDAEDVCRVCGCTDLNGCPGGCSWIVRAGAESLCTACIDHATEEELDAFDAEQEEDDD
ncbi:MAG TPA: hypothetical protein VM492_13520 [Sumerlaeia bacterium]|nr:hypothetical protein [Sumerlaeia bacterium]